MGRWSSDAVLNVSDDNTYMGGGGGGVGEVFLTLAVAIHSCVVQCSQ